MIAPSSLVPPLPEATTPTDFPHGVFGAVGGAQTKVLALKVGDEYTGAESVSARYARYDICFDLVNQLQTYCYRKLDEHPDWTPQILLRKLSVGIARRVDWGCNGDEQQWILKQLCHRMKWPESTDEREPREFKSLCATLIVKDPKYIESLLGLKFDSEGKLERPKKTVDTVVDEVRKRLGTYSPYD